ncbi:hypothetical protein [Rhodanobacter aciditrophus]|uniref:hypothetical protein n=1 Tax=Rhodanobacter aciditrophus TaxID=1623218 RepID=UPI003CF573EF
MPVTRLGGLLGCMVVIGGFLLWHYGRNATMPTLAEEARLAPPATATAVRFKPGAWACTGEEFKLQVSDRGSYYATPVVTRIVGGPPEFCRAVDTSRDYALPAQTAHGMGADTPCADRSCVAFVARVAVDGRDCDWTLYAPNSFIAATR